MEQTHLYSPCQARRLPRCRCCARPVSGAMHLYMKYDRANDFTKFGYKYPVS
jgi:hypothetical protein